MNFRFLLPAASLLLILICCVCPGGARAASPGGAYPKIEAVFELPQVQGNPFDFTQNDVLVTFARPDGAGEVVVPAFFDGGHTWRARHTPDAPGKYAIRGVTLNGGDARPQGLAVREFDVTGSPRPGFIRIDPNDKMRWAYDDGSPYYPVGYNLAWRSTGAPPLVDSLARMGKAGVNWTRIWTDAWDGKNLDWAADRSAQPPLGQLSLPTAKLWDDIVTAAEKNGIRFHFVLQHHGQYSTHADANWDGNPWNKANGGWLENPVQFFSDPKAIALTKNKYRYILARWGSSPVIMAWELFNEVEFTDAFEKDLPAVAAWHAQMAKFIREQDRYKHLITTSSRVTEPSLWTATDYYEAHVYPPDILAAVAALDDEKLDRPYFYGEIGGSAFGAQVRPADTLHTILWGGVTSQASGGAEYWYWDVVEPQNLNYEFTSLQKFIAQSHLLAHPGLRPLEVTARTPNLVALRFGPGGDWGPAKKTTFTARRSGLVEGLGGMSSYLQGTGKNHAMFPSATFNVDYPADGTFAVRIDETTPDGARLEVSVDGRRAVSLVLPPAPPPARPQQDRSDSKPRQNVRVDATLELPLSAGAHVVRLENTGADWVHLRQFTLTPYTSELAVLGKGGSDYAMLWVYRREPGGQPVTGTLAVPGLAGGAYRAVWWDANDGKPLHEQRLTVTDGQPLSLTTPPVAGDVAVWIERATAAP